MTSFLKVTDIQVYGNQRLKYEDIVTAVNVKKGDKLFATDLKTIHERLMSIRWIKEAVIKKDLSGVIHIKIKETQALAILRLKDRTFLVDNDGVLLEDIGDSVVLFLPVLVDIDPKEDYKAYKEALSFVSFLKNHTSYTSKGRIEITGKRPEDITVMIDGVQIKIGSGDYDKKISRLDFVRQEIQRRNLNVEVIDVRFKDRVVVRTSKESNDKVIVEKERR
ncbi:MAG: FtsQ-type POTRA domain-containing protein [Thermodesulfovibrionales bacterium]|nr:FtsQ-type POTRA domain-containing protein [Thermodesulfovibrionales bacterium]